MATRRSRRTEPDIRSDDFGKITTEEGKQLTISTTSIIGHGSFGVVFKATIVETNQIVAIKKVFQDRRFKNRELSIMKQLHHPNVVALSHSFFSSGKKEGDLYLNLVLEYIPESLDRMSRSYRRSMESMPMHTIRLYMYQLCRAVAYIHAIGICHRDIKPQNLLIDPITHVLKLCDFGSAKMLEAGKPSVAYICSRYYRAPELIFGCTNYATPIDIWSCGCVFAEMMLGRPVFAGDTGIDQLVEIIKILGTPTKRQIVLMNESYCGFKFPQIEAVPWARILRPDTPKLAIDLLQKMLVYEPSLRISMTEACAHPLFDELRAADFRLASGRPPPELFNFTPIELAVSPSLNELLIPVHARNPKNWPPSEVLARAVDAGMGREIKRAAAFLKPAEAPSTADISRGDDATKKKKNP